jgi:hypothetical protein
MQRGPMPGSARSETCRCGGNTRCSYTSSDSAYVPCCRQSCAMSCSSAREKTCRWRVSVQGVHGVAWRACGRAACCVLRASRGAHAPTRAAGAAAWRVLVRLHTRWRLWSPANTTAACCGLCVLPSARDTDAARRRRRHTHTHEHTHTHTLAPAEGPQHAPPAPRARPRERTHLAGGVVRRVEQHKLGALAERRAQRLLWHGPVRRLQLHGHELGADLGRRACGGGQAAQGVVRCRGSRRRRRAGAASRQACGQRVPCCCLPPHLLRHARVAVIHGLKHHHLRREGGTECFPGSVQGSTRRHAGRSA